MALPAGQKLGAYEIQSKIGEGGMGEVYRARDTRLGRDVAIKVLPPHLATDAEARARFEREARSVAALSHPNILAIHDFGVHGDVAFAVLELLVGETLRQRLTGAPIPARKTIEIGTQIAQGLAAAHEHGIAHRDLKPENVFICADGRVKILDFGLARSVAPDTDTSDSPTALLRRTDPGTVLGTVGYMSPEQVRGLAADQRSDIFSFGCVLFEMLTGQRAFRGETAAETMTAILREEPLDPADDSSLVPAAIEPVLRHCLEKRPEDRFQSARDLAFVLQAQGAMSQTSSGRSTTAAIPDIPPRRSSARVAALGAAAALAVAAFAAGRYLASRGASTAAGHAVAFTQVTDLPGVETMPGLSPDGKTVVYSSDAKGNGDLYVIRVGSRAPVLLTGDSPLDDTQPAWSPDGEHIAFRSERDGGGVFIMSSTGESVRRLTDYGFSPSWSPDGTEIAVSAGTFFSPTDRGATTRGVWAVDVKSGRRRDIATAHEGLQPSWSPHGWRVAAWGLRGASGQRDIWTFAADGSDAAGEGVPVTADAALDWSPTWSADGAYLYFSSNRGGTMNLWRVAIDERSGRVLGEPEPLTTPSIWSGHFSVSRDGSAIAYASLDWRSTLFRAELDAKREVLVGSPVPILKGTRPIRDHALSPDGQWIAFNEASSQEDLFVARTDGTQYRRLTDDAFRDRGPAWSPDGRQLTFYSDRTGSYELFGIRPDGSGLEQMTAFGGGANFSIWSPDGSRLAFAGVNSNGWYIIPASAKSLTRTTPEPGFGSDIEFWPFSWSQIGNFIAGVLRRGEGTTSGVGVYALDTKTARRVPNFELDRWAVPIWIDDGRRLIVRDGSGLLIVHVDTGEARRVLEVRGYVVGHSVDVSRDGRWVTYTETGTEGDIWIATLNTPK